jgi:hypothetical protein
LGLLPPPASPEVDAPRTDPKKLREKVKKTKRKKFESADRKM